ncbi:MAG: hydrogenase expression/formation protein HypE [Actinomycetota bacterium]|nr:hydrogenase expression/formation protein HypE [Actinomycetota bacterium]
MEPEKNKKIFKDKIIQLSHGDGGIKTSELISNLILKYFGNKTLNKLMDSAVIKGSSQKIAFTTDSFVVNPIFFPGGDIGKLAVCGTINDLVTSGCTPSGLSLSFILEEGFAVKDLIKILSSMKKVLKESGAVIVTGDTKVVERGIADKIYINTSGIGFIPDKLDISPCRIKEGDAILLNGDIGEHGAAILGERKEFDFKSDIKSDCAPLSSLVSDIISVSSNIHALRDATRGGLASILFELSEASNTTFEIHEEKIPVKKEVRGICEFLGLDPLYMTNEGKMAVFVDKKDAEAVLNKMKKNKYGKNSRIIGRVSGKNKDKSGRVFLITELGTRRILDLQYSEQLPRIC